MYTVNLETSSAVLHADMADEEEFDCQCAPSQRKAWNARIKYLFKSGKQRLCHCFKDVRHGQLKHGNSNLVWLPLCFEIASLQYLLKGWEGTTNE